MSTVINVPFLICEVLPVEDGVEGVDHRLLQSLAIVKVFFFKSNILNDHTLTFANLRQYQDLKIARRPLTSV